MSTDNERDDTNKKMSQKNFANEVSKKTLSNKSVEKKTLGVSREMPTTTVQKWGNSLAVRIPSAIAEAAAIKQGVELLLAINEEGLQLIPKKKKATLEDLLARITPENKHAEIDVGITGKELI